MTKPMHVEIEGHDLRLSNLQKVLYPQAGFTKAQVIDYYSRVARFMLPHLRARPLTLKRYPGGVDESFFYEKQCPSHHPDWVPTQSVPSEGSHRQSKQVDYCMIDSVASLVWVANLASLEMHVLLARADDVQRPTSVVFDLDPGPPAQVQDCARVALELKRLLTGLGLRSFVKTSGGKGLHLYIPLNTPVTYEQTKPFARAVAGIMERRDVLVTSRMRKDLRGGKVFIDWSQNDPHKTTVCVYSLRARAHPTVSMPLRWDEVEALAENGDVACVTFEAAEAIDRLTRVGDLFAPVLTMEQQLPSL